LTITKLQIAQFPNLPDFSNKLVIPDCVYRKLG